MKIRSLRSWAFPSPEIYYNPPLHHKYTQQMFLFTFCISSASRVFLLRNDSLNEAESVYLTLLKSEFEEHFSIVYRERLDDNRNSIDAELCVLVRWKRSVFEVPVIRWLSPISDAYTRTEPIVRVRSAPLAHNTSVTKRNCDKLFFIIKTVFSLREKNIFSVSNGLLRALHEFEFSSGRRNFHEVKNIFGNWEL